MKEIVIFIKSHGSWFHTWLPLNLSVCVIPKVKTIEVSLNIGGREFETLTPQIYV